MIIWHMPDIYFQCFFVNERLYYESNTHVSKKSFRRQSIKIGLQQVKGEKSHNHKKMLKLIYKISTMTLTN